MNELNLAVKVARQTELRLGDIAKASAPVNLQRRLEDPTMYKLIFSVL